MAALQVQPAKDNLIVTGHTDAINCIVWLPGDRIVTGSDDKSVRIWNLTNGTQEGTPMVHEDAVRGVITTKDGRIISCSDKDEHLMLWKAETQELVDQQWSDEDYGPAWCIALSQDEQLLASCHRRWLVVWDMTRTMRVKHCIDYESIGGYRYERGPGNVMISVCFSPDGKRVVTSYYTPGLVVFDVESGERVFGPLGFERILLRATIWSSNGDQLFCGFGDGSIRCLNSSTGESIGEPWIGHRSHVQCFSLSPDGKWLASGSDDSMVRFWDIESSEPVAEPLQHVVGVWDVAFSRSGEYIACSGGGRRVSIWRVPWWNNDDQQALRLLDLSAVISADGPSNPPLEHDLHFLDISARRRPLPTQDCPTANPSDDRRRQQRSALSWTWWKRIPRFVLKRSHPMSTGYAPSRTYAASRDSLPRSPPSLPQQEATASGSHADFTVVVESYSSGESSEDEDARDTPADDVEISRIGCCGLLSRRGPRETQAREGHVPARPSASATRPHNSMQTATSVPPSTGPEARDILELSAIVRSSDTP